MQRALGAAIAVILFGIPLTGEPPPRPDESDRSWGLILMVALIVLALLAVGLLVLARRKHVVRTPMGEGYAGPAPYQPSFAVPADEADSIDERLALAREDVTRLGEELDHADLPLDRPEVAGHLQSAMDACADARRSVDTVTTDAQLRTLRDTVEYARWRLACGKAVLSGAMPPPRRAACFIDPTHGRSATDRLYQPPHGARREVPVCAACAQRLSKGSQ